MRVFYKAIINLFIFWHLFALTIWLLPYAPGLVGSSLMAVRPYMITTGFAQNWAMFAPEPERLDAYVEARITYADGHVKSWNYPRMQDLGYAERYRRERFHKMIENANRRRYSYLWPSLARYAARVNNLYPKCPPVSVELVRHYRYIPPPGLPVPGYYVETSFFNAPVKPADLR